MNTQVIESERLSVDWHTLSPEQVSERLGTKLEAGLTADEAARRLEKYGPNRLAEAPRTAFITLLLNQLKGFIVLLLIAAAVVSAVLGDYIEAAAILAIVVLNAVLGVVQESRAEQALAALKKLAAPEAQTLRDGRRVSIPAEGLVPGDLVFLEAGNYIPADIRLLETANLKVEEAALTGESLPVQKNAAQLVEADVPLGDRKNTAFMGTLVSYGRGRGIVVATGMHTQLGLIARMLQAEDTSETPLQRRLDGLGRLLGWGALGICAVVFAVGALRSGGNPQAILSVFMIAVSLAIAAVPEGLAAIVTISLALGMREMVRRNALIRRLASVETLGSATVICSDKTGTLTQNAMTVTRLWVGGAWVEISGQGYNPVGDFRMEGKPIHLDDYPGIVTSLRVGALNNDAQLEEMEADGETSYRIIGDPTEGALIVAAAKGGLLQDRLNEAFPRQNEIPFDSVRKRMVTLHALPADFPTPPGADGGAPDRFAVVVKGAPDVVLELCSYGRGQDDHVFPLDETRRMQILEANDRMTQEALRVLALAYRLVPEAPESMESETVENDLIFAGLVGMIDPPRPEVAPALAEARQAGIRTVMITGDFPNTARAIAEAIGLLGPGHQVLSGPELSGMDDETLRREAKQTDVYARVSPEHKMRIVDALQANGQVVAMTGDGVNDAPAIRRADIGIAMGITGTDVAKETADMVLLDDNYASIVAAVEQGRVIYSNIRKFVYYLLSCNLAEIAIIFLATLVGWPSPLSAIQILWLNLVTDGAPALALGTEKGDPAIMKQPPRPPDEPVINSFMWKGISIQMLADTVITLAAFYIGRYTDPAHIEFAETMAFVTLSCSELLRAYTARSEYLSIWKIGVFENRWMNLAAASSLALILAVVYVPFLQPVFTTRSLGLAQWAEIIPLLVIPSLSAELAKLLFSPMRRRA